MASLRNLEVTATNRETLNSVTVRELPTFSLSM
jgi:hypothetical protein